MRAYFQQTEEVLEQYVENNCLYILTRISLSEIPGQISQKIVPKTGDFAQELDLLRIKYKILKTPQYRRFIFPFQRSSLFVVYEQEKSLVIGLDYRLVERQEDHFPVPPQKDTRFPHLRQVRVTTKEEIKELISVIAEPLLENSKLQQKKQFL